jgi:hypothetical protein
MAVLHVHGSVDDVIPANISNVRVVAVFREGALVFGQTCQTAVCIGGVHMHGNYNINYQREAFYIFELYSTQFITLPLSPSWGCGSMKATCHIYNSGVDAHRQVSLAARWGLCVWVTHSEFGACN